MNNNNYLHQGETHCYACGYKGPSSGHMSCPKDLNIARLDIPDPQPSQWDSAMKNSELHHILGFLVGMQAVVKHSTLDKVVEALEDPIQRLKKVLE